MAGFVIAALVAVGVYFAPAVQAVRQTGERAGFGSAPTPTAKRALHGLAAGL